MYNITFRKLNDNEDEYKMIHKWCQNKNVYQWFEQRKLSYDEIVNKYKNKLNEKKQDLSIIKCNGKDIGLVQIYKYNDDIYEYDLFIGEEDYLDKGIGSIIVNKLNNIIYTKYNSKFIILRPFKRNIRAIKCYQKNDFKIICEYEDKDTLGNNEKFLFLVNKNKNSNLSV